MRSTLITLVALLFASCRASEADESSRPRTPARAAPLATPIYADRQIAPPANPSGLYWEGERLWVWSDAHQAQRSFEPGESGWRAGPVREGPLGTERCVVGRDRLKGETHCVGRHQAGGVLVFAQGSTTGRAFGALPARAGFRDLVSMHALGLIGVLDSVSDHVLWLDRSGALVGRCALPPSSYRIGSAGDDALFALAGGDPELAVMRIGIDGACQPLASSARTAPLRDAYYDAANELLWVAGPEDHAVRRDRGPIEHLGSELVAFEGAALRRGELREHVRFDLQTRGLADPTRLIGAANQVFVSLTGSDRVAWVRRGPNAWELHATSPALGPAGLASDGGRLGVAARLEDRVYVHDTSAGPAATPDVIALDARPRDSLRDLGERLFYGALLWSQSQQRPYTCNSCHWDTESDRRRHPGAREIRSELTRPLGGVGAVAPVFTPGQARTLDAAVDGLVRMLDDRYWRDPAFEESAIRVPVKGGAVRTLEPLETRRALAAFLTAVPVQPGPHLRSDAPELRAQVVAGTRLFLDDCADCHAPRGPDARAALRSPEALLEALRRTPLVLGATGFAHAGAGPSFTEQGNRISPLLGLSRGGPYFASGSAPSLRAVLAGFARERPRVHAGARTEPAYDAQQTAALEAFLGAL